MITALIYDQNICCTCGCVCSSLSHTLLRLCLFVVHAAEPWYTLLRCLKLCSQLARGRGALAVHACPNARSSFHKKSNSSRIKRVRHLRVLIFDPPVKVTGMYADTRLVRAENSNMLEFPFRRVSIRMAPQKPAKYAQTRGFARTRASCEHSFRLLRTCRYTVFCPRCVHTCSSCPRCVHTCSSCPRCIHTCSSCPRCVHTCSSCPRCVHTCSSCPRCVHTCSSCPRCVHTCSSCPRCVHTCSSCPRCTPSLYSVVLSCLNQLLVVVSSFVGA